MDSLDLSVVAKARASVWAIKPTYGCAYDTVLAFAILAQTHFSQHITYHSIRKEETCRKQDSFKLLDQAD